MTQRVRDVMTRNPTTVDSQTTLLEVARRMRDEHIGDVFVWQGGQLAGVVTDRDLAVRGIAEGHDPARTPVIDVCSGDLVTVAPDDDIDRAVALMREHAVRRLPVASGDQVMGVVSLGDLAIAQDRDSALADISAAKPHR